MRPLLLTLSSVSKLWCVLCHPVVQRVANIFKKNGQALRDSGAVVPGDIVTTYFDNHQENIVWFWSVVAAGGIPAILSPLAKDSKTRAAQLGHVIRLFQMPAIVTSKRMVPDLTGPEGLRVTTIETLREAARNKNEINGNAKRRMLSDEPSTKRTKFMTSKPNPVRNDLAVLLFTSGSTGPAKAVELSHSQLIASVQMKSALHGIGPDMNFMSWVCKFT